MEDWNDKSAKRVETVEEGCLSGRETNLVVAIQPPVVGIVHTWSEYFS